MFSISLKRFFILVPIFAAAMVALYIFQFSGESKPIRTIGLIRLALTDDEHFDLKYKNINFFSTDDAEATVYLTETLFENIRVVSATPIENGSRIFFSGDIYVDFVPVKIGDSETLQISAYLPDNYIKITLPYRILNLGASLVFISDDDMETSINTTGKPISVLSISQEKPVNVVFSTSPGKTDFTFSSSLAAKYTTENDFVSCLTAMKNNFVSMTASDADLSAEELFTRFSIDAEKNQRITSSHTAFNEKNFFSATLKGDLINQSAEEEKRDALKIAELPTLIKNNNPAIFDNYSVVSLLLRNSETDILRSLSALTFPTSEPTLSQIAGILFFYSDLYQNFPDLAETFLPFAEKAAAMIEKKLSFKDGIIAFTEEVPAETLLPVSVAMISFGKFTFHEEISAAGYGLFCGHFMNNACAPEIFAKNYLLLFPEVPFFPHYEILQHFPSDTQPVVWNSSKKITCSSGTNSVVLSVEFIGNEIEYLVFRNFPQFKSVEIHNMTYRSASDFEKYNASGYVYDAQKKTLYLKLKHKLQTERITFFY